MSECPECGAPAKNAWAEIQHMEAAHPEIIIQRYHAAGERGFADLLESELQRAQELRPQLQIAGEKALWDKHSMLPEQSEDLVADVLDAVLPVMGLPRGR